MTERHSERQIDVISYEMDTMDLYWFIVLYWGKPEVIPFLDRPFERVDRRHDGQEEEALEFMRHSPSAHTATWRLWDINVGI